MVPLAYNSHVGVNTSLVILHQIGDRKTSVARFLIDGADVDEGCLSGVCVVAIDQMIATTSLHPGAEQPTPAPRRPYKIAKIAKEEKGIRNSRRQNVPIHPGDPRRSRQRTGREVGLGPVEPFLSSGANTSRRASPRDTRPATGVARSSGDGLPRRTSAVRRSAPRLRSRAAPRDVARARDASGRPPRRR